MTTEPRRSDAPLRFQVEHFDGLDVLHRLGYDLQRSYGVPASSNRFRGEPSEESHQDQHAKSVVRTNSTVGVLRWMKDQSWDCERHDNSPPPRQRGATVLKVSYPSHNRRRHVVVASGVSDNSHDVEPDSNDDGRNNMRTAGQHPVCQPDMKPKPRQAVKYESPVRYAESPGGVNKSGCRKQSRSDVPSAVDRSRAHDSSGIRNVSPPKTKLRSQS